MLMIIGGDFMAIKKRGQHYVFQEYLRSWSVNGKIWCKYPGKDPFCTNTNKVAKVRDFYRLEPLNEDEKTFLYSIFHGSEYIDEFQKYLETIYMPLSVQQNIKNYIEQYTHQIPQEIHDALSEIDKITDIAQNNIIEDSHSFIEGKFIRWINALKSKNSNFYDIMPQKDKCDFLFSLCMQYFRTKANKKRFVNWIKLLIENPIWNLNPDKINLEKLVNPIAWYMSRITSIFLYENNAHLTLLINETSIPLITSDQPIINIKADYKNLHKYVTDLVFYYPISPQIAITINDDNLFDIKQLNDNDVNKYNQAIYNASSEFIFSNTDNNINIFSAPSC